MSRIKKLRQRHSHNQSDGGKSRLVYGGLTKLFVTSRFVFVRAVPEDHYLSYEHRLLQVVWTIGYSV
jgi:hypothetical protein